jgi:hypothetical protein
VAENVIAIAAGAGDATVVDGQHQPAGGFAQGTDAQCGVAHLSYSAVPPASRQETPRTAARKKQFAIDDKFAMFPMFELKSPGTAGTMNATKVAHKLKSARKPATKLAVMGATAATAAAVAVGSAPLAGALNVNQQVLTAGPLVNLLPALGITSVGPIALGAIPVIAPEGAFLTLQLVPIGYDTQNIYNTVNALPFQRRPALVGNRNVFDRVYSTSGSAAGQFPAVLGSGIGTKNLVDAYRTQIASINGNTPGGYTPYQPGTVQLPNQTNQELLYLRDPLRPNGGIEARFAPILNLFGVDTTLPTAGVKSNDAGTIKLNTGTVDLTWAYDTISDFPVTLNPFSIVNSLIAGLPTNLLGGVALTGLTGPDGPTNTTELGLNVAGVLGILNRLSGGASDVSDGKAFYGMLLPNDLPILEPLRLPSRLINAVLGTDLGTPFADALQPAFKILVNTGYSDVITPNNLDTCASKCNTADAQTYAQLGYTAYDRSFLTAATPEPFLSVNPLTPAEWLQVPGDVVKALIGGFGSVFAPGLALPGAATPSTRAVSTPAPAIAAESPATPDAAVVTETATETLSVADAPVTGAPVTPVRQARGAGVRAPQSHGGAVRRAASQVKAALTPKRAAAARSATR